MDRAIALVLVATFLCLCTRVPGASAKYVLHVVADDLGYDDVGWYLILNSASNLRLSVPVSHPYPCLYPIHPASVHLCLSHLTPHCVYLSFRRNHQAQTPTLDDLVAHGIEIPEFYTYMMCAPARGSTLSGRYPMRLGLYDNNQAMMMMIRCTLRLTLRVQNHVALCSPYLCCG